MLVAGLRTNAVLGAGSRSSPCVVVPSGPGSMIDTLATVYADPAQTNNFGIQFDHVAMARSGRVFRVCTHSDPQKDTRHWR